MPQRLTTGIRRLRISFRQLVIPPPSSGTLLRRSPGSHAHHEAATYLDSVTVLDTVHRAEPRVFVFKRCEAYFEGVIRSKVQAASGMEGEAVVVPIGGVVVMFRERLSFRIVGPAGCSNFADGILVFLCDLHAAQQNFEVRNPALGFLHCPTGTDNIRQRVAAPVCLPLNHPATANVGDQLHVGCETEARCSSPANAGAGVGVAEVLPGRRIERKLEGRYTGRWINRWKLSNCWFKHCGARIFRD